MDDERLILEVEQHKINYEIYIPFYKDNVRKDKALHLIAVGLGVEGEKICLFVCSRILMHRNAS
jgi:hypothetical protein